MNESFFGQYSVFCVFGSVVGCVVVPLIAQVLQQQSMECMILSAIVISLTAAHLNKKGGNDSTNSKLLLAKELERKKINHSNNNTKKHKQTHSQHINNNNNNNTTHSAAHQFHLNEQQYMQQHEHLKVAEMERRNEEKKLKKIRKREERLKKREEESKKQKELEERYRSLKEKRIKQKENYYRTTNNSYFNTSVACFEKYCPNASYEKKPRSTTDDNKVRNKTFYYSNNQRIPRFERNRTASNENPLSKSSLQYGNRSVTGNLTIGCTNLSASCSSLSSISSSGSSSPPLPASPPPSVNPAWKVPFRETPCNQQQQQQPTWSSNSSPAQQPQNDRGLKSYSNTRHGRSRISLNIDSSSLFCTHQGNVGEKTLEKAPINSFNGGEYSLFGPQSFGSSLTKTSLA